MPKHPTRLLLAGLLAGLAFEALFYSKWPGISALLFSLILLAGAALALRWTATPLTRGNLWLIAALLFFSGMVAVRANGFLVALNLMASLTLLALMALYLARQNIHTLALIAHLVAPVQAALLALVRSVELLAGSGRSQSERLHGQGRRMAPVLRGLLLALPLLVIFGGLLMAADMVFADLVDRVLRLDFLEHIDQWIARGVMILVAGWLVAGGLAQLVWRNAEDKPHGRLAAQGLALPRIIGPTESVVMINAVNLLFLFFVVIQLSYLFGGLRNITPEGFTYAEYARRGFGELLVVALGVLGLLVGLDALTRRETPRQQRFFNASSTLMVLLTLVMLVSAFKRLLLYEEVYGFTQMRIYPHVFMVWLGLLLLWFVATRWLRPNRFGVGVLVAALGFVATLNLLNPDAFIVRQNMARYQSGILSNTSTRYGEHIDVNYFAQLSEDAVPALLAARAQLKPADKAHLDELLQDKVDQLQRNRTEWQPWPSFNLARWRAWRALTE